MAVVMEDSSSNHDEFTFAFHASGMTRGARVAAYMMFETSFTALVHMLMSERGRIELGGYIFTRYAFVTVSSRESVLMSNSSLVIRDAPEKPLTKVSLTLLDTTVGM